MQAPNPVARARTWVIPVLLALYLGGCGRGMSGIYQAPDGLVTLEFEDDGEVYVTAYGGGTFQGEYELDGARVIVKGPLGSQVFTQEGDQLSDGAGLTLVKKKRP
jgi:hypothetical protein